MYPLNDLPLLCRGEISQVVSLALHFNLACSAQVELVVHLGRDRGQQRESPHK